MGIFQRQPIKRLTLFGFILVALPLVIALLYSVYKINVLSDQGVSAIYQVAKLIEVNKKLDKQLSDMERSASQYLVLNDIELKQTYVNQYAALSVFVKEELNVHHDKALSLLADKFLALNQQIYTVILTYNSDDILLNNIQENFEALDVIEKLIEERNEALISMPVQEFQKKMHNVSALILESLIVIPIVLVIAIIFFKLITEPLRQLKPQIKQLADGVFAQQISVQGSQEIVQIAETLESMRLRLHALELQKSSFIRHISHELKTPLAAIREGAELLYDNSVGRLNGEQQEINSIIRSSVARLQLLIEDLLNFNIVLDSTSLQDKQQVDLRVVVNQAIDDRKLEIKRKQLLLNLDLPAIGLVSNQQHLRVIIENLLSNAVNYAPQQSTIDIQARLKEGHLLFTVSDQGPGINDNQKQKIFDAFYQGDPSESSIIKSSGLGLTIVQELVMRLNGDINVLPTDIGACFQVVLPHAYAITRKLSVRP